MSPKALAEYVILAGDALAVSNQAFPADINGGDASALRVACFTVVLTELLAATRT